MHTIFARLATTSSIVLSIATIASIVVIIGTGTIAIITIALVLLLLLCFLEHALSLCQGASRLRARHPWHLISVG